MTAKPGWARKRDRLRRREADAPPTTPAAAPSAPPTTPAAAPWALSAAEWRLLVITFVGGLGSIVAGAGIIGGAIAIARTATRGPGFWFLTIAVGAVGFVFGMVVFRRAVRGVYLPAPVRLFAGAIASIFVVAYGVLIVVGLLVLIGRAAGIK